MKRMTTWIAAATGAALMALTAGSFFAQQSATSSVKEEVALRAAMEKETVQGDLKAALEEYKKLAQSRDRSVAARALVRMADCYHKLGDAEARKVYERVIREYADQKDAVVQARARLSADDSAKASGVSARQLWVSNDVDFSGASGVGISPDGRYLAFANRGLAVRDLIRGETRTLTAGAAGGDYAYRAVFSPDGKQIAYNWASFKEGVFDEYSLRLVGIDGSRPRVLLRREGVDPQVSAWSPDGKTIAAAFWNYGQDRSWQIGLISVADGSVVKLKTVGWRAPAIGGFSKDGRFLVYSVPDSPSQDDGGILALSVDGSRETTLTQSPKEDWAPAWSPDSQAVLFLSDRSGTPDLWSIRVVDGKPQGGPLLVKANIGRVINLGFTSDGSFFYGAMNLRRDVFVAGLDPETLSITSQPTLVTENVVGSNQQPSWSPDGKLIAFFRGKEQTDQTIVLRSLSDGAERILPTKLHNVCPCYGVAPVWFPDSRSLLIGDVTNGKRLVRKIDIETGQDRMSGDFEIGWPEIRLSPDGKAVYHSVNVGDGRSALVKRDLETAELTEIHRMTTNGSGWFGLALSPDGSRFGFALNAGPNQRTVMTLPVEGGTARELYRGDFEHPLLRGGTWTKNARYYVTVAAEPDGHRLWAFPADGGEPRKLDVSMQIINGPVVSPDGRRIAFTGTESKPELWVIRNLLSAAQARK